KVLDFGISKLLEGETTDFSLTKGTVGTPGYMSPEQLRGSKDIDARSDIWAMGVILYRSLAGHHPFPGSDAALAIAIATEQPTPLDESRPDLPPELVNVIMRALERRAADRWPSATELGRALSPFGGEG